jgi:hypothetical protein
MAKIISYQSKQFLRNMLTSSKSKPYPLIVSEVPNFIYISHQVSTV